MKKTLLISIICLVFALSVNAAPTDYTPLKDILNKMADNFEYVGKEAEKVKDADSAAALIKSFTKKMEAVIPELSKMMKKYPELKGMKDPAKAPEELKPVVDRMTKLQPVMQTGMMKIMAYGNDPKVQEATKEMQAVFMKMAEMEKKK